MLFLSKFIRATYYKHIQKLSKVSWTSLWTTRMYIYAAQKQLSRRRILSQQKIVAGTREYIGWALVCTWQGVARATYERDCLVLYFQSTGNHNLSANQSRFCFKWCLIGAILDITSQCKKFFLFKKALIIYLFKKALIIYLFKKALIIYLFFF